MKCSKLPINVNFLPSHSAWKFQFAHEVLIVIYEVLNIFQTSYERFESIVSIIFILSLWGRDYDCPHFLVKRSKLLI